MQKPTESAAEFAAALRELAKSCNFGQFLERSLRDRFVIGLAHAATRERLFEIMVGFWSRAIALSDFENFWFFELSGLSRTTMSLSTFLYLVKKKNFEIMVGFWSKAIALSDFENCWFFELSGLSRTTMSPSTFLYLVKKKF